MDIIDRYLHAIEFWLPNNQKRDIIAEISEDIHSQIEEQQSQLGRTLSQDEIETLLKQRGSPVLVANRYLPQRSLIGPVLFPIYLFVLRFLPMSYVVPMCAIFTVTYREVHPAATLGQTIAAAVGNLWTNAFVGLGIVTLAFAALQWLEPQTHFLSNWNPRKLPAVRNPRQISRSTSAFELAINLAIIPWWIAYLRGPQLFGFLWLMPVWNYFFWGFLVITALNATFSAVCLIRPYWTTLRALARLVSDSFGSALFLWLLRADVIDATRGPDLHNLIQTILDHTFPWAVIVTLVIFAVDLYRVIRVSRPHDLVPHSLSSASL